MFDRYISIDWSGAGTETDRVDLRVVMMERGRAAQVVNPPGARRGVCRWTRLECRNWLVEVLSERNLRTIVALDFGFGLPWGADRQVFDCDGWRGMLERIGDLYSEKQTARAVAQFVNAQKQFNGHGPYRFNDNRTDFRFYLDRQVAYYRLVEQAIPQAISQWYLGSGGVVGFHTITGLAMIEHLIGLREQDRIEFQVWPHEIVGPDGTRHLLVESYPAICPRPEGVGPCEDKHQRDAWKVLLWMIEADERGELARAFKVPSIMYGRCSGVSVEEQIRFEGWIFGVI